MIKKLRTNIRLVNFFKLMIPSIKTFCNKDAFKINNTNNVLDQINFTTNVQKIDLTNLGQCTGCGVELQITDSKNVGYVPYEKIKEKEVRHLVCERCFKLKNYQNFENSKKDEEKSNHYTLVSKNINIDKLINELANRISAKAHIFYLLDITDLKSSINIKMIKEIEKKGNNVTFIVNKYDILPKDVNEERINVWVGENLKTLLSEYNINYSYILVSSKNGHNFDYVIHKLKKIKEQFKKQNESFTKQKIYLIGPTNVGKSSFINKLMIRSNKLIDNNHSIQVYDKEDPEIKENTAKLDHLLPPKLTDSPLPGTTIGITKLEHMKLGVKLFDTPGIPCPNSMLYQLDSLVDIIGLTIRNKLRPFSLNIKQGTSIWIGALCRIDVLSGEDKYFSFFFGENVTIHKTNLLNGEEIFEKQAGKLLRPCITTNYNDVKWKKHSFSLKCKMFSLLNFDIVINGLGWFSISGKDFIDFEVYLPEDVQVYIREKPMMPYEIMDKGLKKNFGKTINSNTRINQKQRGKLDKTPDKNNKK